MKLILSFILASATSLLAHQDLPKQILIQSEWIQVKTSDVTELLTKFPQRGTKLRNHLQKQITTGNASILDTSAILARPGETSRVSSINYIIYPTSRHTVPGLMDYWEQSQKNNNFKSSILFSQEFEERSTGVITEVEPKVGTGRDHLTISIDVELQNSTYFPPPLLDNLQTNSTKLYNGKFKGYQNRAGATIISGEYLLIARHPAKSNKDGSADYTHTVLVIMRATIKTP